MLTIWRTADQQRRLSRRRLLQAGLAAPLYVSPLLNVLSSQPSMAMAPVANCFGRAKRCLLVFLNGGPSQLDTFDMKPDAPAEIRGELHSIPTNVSGLRVSELLPKMAMLADRYKVVRSVTHTASVHTTGVYTMLTGTYHRTPTVDQIRIEPQDHPHLGAVYAASQNSVSAAPPFVCLPTLFRAPPVEGIWPGQTAGFLGRKYDPFVIEGEKTSAHFSVPEIELPASMTAQRLADRRALLAKLDELARTHERTRSRAEKNKEAIFEQAWTLLGSQRLHRAVDLQSEPASTHERYGRHLFGQGLLLARRLIEEGIPFVTVYWIDPEPPGEGGGEFDSHGQIYRHMRERLLPPTDQGLSALIADLFERGLSDDTLLVVMSEFGRTPYINKDAGRDHWPAVQSILLAGAGISGGTIYGASDRHAASVTADPVTPPDLGQTILHLMGVPADLLLRDPQGRPIAASQGRVLENLIA